MTSSKLDFCQFIVTSQGEGSRWLKSSDSIEDFLSCDDSSYNKGNLEVSDSCNGVHSESRTSNMAVVVVRTRWKRSLPV